MVFKRISGLVNPFAERLFDYPDIIFPCFEFEKDKASFIEKIRNFKGDIFVEYGSGSGNHLIEVAKRTPQSLCVGFEIRFKRAVRTIEKANSLGVHNIVIFRNKGEYLTQLFPPKRIKGLFINFPDPWAKKRWLKHRVLTKKVIDDFSAVVGESGFISIKTDHDSYFKDFLSEYENTKPSLYTHRYTSSDLHTLLKDESVFAELTIYYADVKSEFEKLFESQKKNINYLLLAIDKELENK